MKIKVKGFENGKEALEFIINTENHTALVPTDNGVIELNIEYHYSRLKINNAFMFIHLHDKDGKWTQFAFEAYTELFPVDVPRYELDSYISKLTAEKCSYSNNSYKDDSRI